MSIRTNNYQVREKEPTCLLNKSMLSSWIQSTTGCSVMSTRAHVSATDINSGEGKKEGKERVPQTHFYHATPLLTNQQWLLITY